MVSRSFPEIHWQVAGSLRYTGTLLGLLRYTGMLLGSLRYTGICWDC